MGDRQLRESLEAKKGQTISFWIEKKGKIVGKVVDIGKFHFVVAVDGTEQLVKYSQIVIFCQQGKKSAEDSIF